jgi:hypothetical protein
MNREASDNQDTNLHIDQTRRSLLKASYVAPAIITLSAMPSFASAGSSAGGTGRRAERLDRLQDLLERLRKRYG